MTITIKAEKREGFGKNECRRLRKKGLVPAILYGEAVENVPLVLDKKDIVQILKSDTGENTIFKVAFASQVRDAMIKEMDMDPVDDTLLHLDLIQIAMDKAIRITVPIVHTGDPIGVKTEGGFIDFVTRTVDIECLPKDIPDSLQIDISGLHMHQSFKAESLALPPGVKLLSEPGTVLVLISVPHKEEEFPGEKPEEAVEEAKEPEVIKKERAAEEAEEKAKQLMNA